MKRLSFFRALKTSLRARVFTMTIAALVLITVSFTSISIYTEMSSHTAVLIKNGKTLAELLADNVRLGLFAENEALFKEPVEGILRQDDVASAAIFTLEGRLMKNGHNPHMKGDDKMDAGAVKKALSIVERSGSLYYSGDDGFFEFWAPVVSRQTAYAGDGYFMDETANRKKERLIGFVKISLDKTRLKQDMTELLLRNSLIGAIFMLLSIIISYSILNRILNPLRTLTSAVTMLGKEGSAQLLAVDTEDEVGRLAASFNEMLKAIEKREAEKQHVEAQLRQSQKMEAVGQLAGGIAHDFNNILTAIISYGNVLQMKMPAEDPLRRNVERILSASERASALTQGLLAFSRKQPVSLQPVNLNSTVKNVEKLLTKLTTEDIEFRTQFTVKEPVIMGDIGQIEQILMNLVTNARDAMPGGGLLTIETAVVELDQAFVDTHGNAARENTGEYALLSVADAGVGMEPETISRIFEPFFTTKDQGKGTGLGLSIVYGIIKQHKGIIDVFSRPGTGTAFRVYFPLIRSAVEGKEKEPTVFQPSRGGSETILLAEDDEDVRDVTTSIFEDFGYTVIAASDGEEAINAFNRNRDRINIVIMPLRNGREVYKEISGEKPGIKVLFTSGYTADIITKKGLIDDGMPFISKPVSPTMLLKKVREVLDK